MTDFIKFDYVWLVVAHNPYFETVKQFIKYKFDIPLLNDTIIFITGNYSSIILEYKEKYPEKRMVAYNWEQLCDGNQWVNVHDICESMRLADEIWDYNDLNAAYLRLYHNITPAHIFQFEYFKKLEILNNISDPKIDVLFYGLMNERRARILSNLQLVQYNKFNIFIALGTSIEDSYKCIENSKIVINLHAFEPYHRQEQERIGFLVSNKKCVISEPSQENYFNPAIIECPVDKMAGVISNILAGSSWKAIGVSGYESFKNGKCSKRVNY